MIHRYVLHNDSIVEADRPMATPGQVGMLAGWGVFSTLRVSRGVLFVYDRHFERMKRDAKLMRVPFPEDPEWLKSRLLKLVEANGAYDATFRVAVVRNKGGIWQGPGVDREFDLFGLTTGLTDWGSAVKLSVVPEGRHAASRFAGTKVLSWGQNLTWYEEAHERGFDEVLLLNERGEVSECTSANMFAAFGNTVCTPSLSSGCLPGITRALLLEEIQVPGLRMEERTLSPRDLEAADSVFITSTTRDVLPVAEIEGLSIRQKGDAPHQLRRAFQAYIDQYVGANAPAVVS
jgi:branched-chain amino acid aminotransferase